MEVNSDSQHVFSLTWQLSTDRMKRTWKDPDDATEFGAVGLSILFIKELTGFTFVERAVKGTGVDYWLGTDDDLFQRKARIEISGIGRGDAAMVRARFKAKAEQAKQSEKSGLPLFVSIVEFGRPFATVKQP